MATFESRDDTFENVYLGGRVHCEAFFLKKSWWTDP